MENGHNVYIDVLQAIGVAQSTKGEGGCFAEAYATINSVAGIIEQSRGYYSQENYYYLMDQLAALVASIPQLHNDRECRSIQQQAMALIGQ